MNKSINDIKKTPLYQCHLDAGARMVPFGGWAMPVSYKTGIIVEHNHTRNKAGIFDICHMGEIYLRGADALQNVEYLLSCDVTNLEVGQCRYCMMLNNDAGIIDDLIVFRTAENELLLVVNAGTRENDFRWICDHLRGDVTAIDESDSIAKVDIQGPLSAKILSELIDEKIMDLKRFRFGSFVWDGIEVLISRTGYTGERGYELYFPEEHASKIWNRLMAVDDVLPIGLGARDTLRMEKGFSLYGNDIDQTRTPAEAGLHRFYNLDTNFNGKEALEKQIAAGIKRTLVGFKIMEGRRCARAHFDVIVDGKVVGEVTSGAFSPSLNQGIGYCYIDVDLAKPGQEIVLTDGKRTELKGKIAAFPLYRKPKK